MSWPVLVVGDVQGDFERLIEALAPYPEDEIETVFLGDFFQGGPPGAAGGVSVARIARSRRNSRHVIGNHDLFLLAVLEESRGIAPPPGWRTAGGRPLEEVWISRRGDLADRAGVAADAGLEAWLRSLPLMLGLDDGTLVQHADDDVLISLGADLAEVNSAAAELLAEPAGVFAALRYTVGRHAFDRWNRAEAYLRHFGGTRIVHGHTPHWERSPLVLHQGRVWNFDGRFSRFWPRVQGEGTGPIGATVGLLPRFES